MAYRLSAITIRIDNLENHKKEMQEIWRDITSGKLPVLFDSEHKFQKGISPIYQYSNYSKNGYDLSIMGVESIFFKRLDIEINKGSYKAYDFSDKKGNLEICSKKAWEQVDDDYKKGIIERAFCYDYESNVPPEYTKDGKAHCYLYISVKKQQI